MRSRIDDATGGNRSDAPFDRCMCIQTFHLRGRDAPRGASCVKRYRRRLRKGKIISTARPAIPLAKPTLLSLRRLASRGKSRAQMSKEIRFAVGSREDIRSSVCPLWANKDELFLAARSTAGLSKISFHKSGICRLAVVSQSPRAPIASWTRPHESETGVTPMFDVIVPAFTVPNSFRDKLPPTKKELVFLNPPDARQKIIIRILPTRPVFTEDDVRKLAGSKPIYFMNPTLDLANTNINCGSQ